MAKRLSGKLALLALVVALLVVIPLSIRALVELVIQTGSSFPSTDATERMRARINLSPFVSKGADKLRKAVPTQFNLGGEPWTITIS